MGIKRIFEDRNYAVSWGVFSVIIVAVFLSIFLIAKTVSEIKVSMERPPYYNSISVVGEGETVSVPDIATFNFSVTETSESVESAQGVVTKKINDAIDYLKKNGVEEKDIETAGYNIYPRNEWQQSPCTQFSCPPGKSVLVGYEVTQSVNVKVRDTKKAGDYLNSLGSIGITNLSGLNFTTDDPNKLHDEALEKAIADAKSQAENIAKNLGVKLGKVVGYNEDQGYYPAAYDSYGMGGGEVKMSGSIAPELPTGEQKTTVRVYVTYELR